jgi:carboxymethylenebutenolidase
MLAGAVDLLCSHDTVRGTGIGVVGFARGAALALWLAVDRPQQIRAVVPFYGLPPAGEEPDWARMQASVEGHFAAIDDDTPSEAVEALHVRLDGLDKEVRVFTYPNTAHGFFDDTRADVYDEDAAWQAWVRTLEFLRARLG